MEIINETKHSNKKLKMLLTKIADEMGVIHKKMVIRIKSGGGSGCYYRYNGKKNENILIRSEELSRINFVFRHELGHHLGLKHKDMMLTNGYWRKNKLHFSNDTYQKIKELNFFRLSEAKVGEDNVGMHSNDVHIVGSSVRSSSTAISPIKEKKDGN